MESRHQLVSGLVVGIAIGMIAQRLSSGSGVAVAQTLPASRNVRCDVVSWSVTTPIRVTLAGGGASASAAAQPHVTGHTFNFAMQHGLVVLTQSGGRAFDVHLANAGPNDRVRIVQVERLPDDNATFSLARNAPTIAEVSGSAPNWNGLASAANQALIAVPVLTNATGTGSGVTLVWNSTP